MTEAPRAALVVLTRDDEVRGAVSRASSSAGTAATTRSCACAEPTEAAAGSWPTLGLPVAALFGGMGGADPDGLTVLRGLHRGASGRDGRRRRAAGATSTPPGRSSRR